jgi:hypothetical protein
MFKGRSLTFSLTTPNNEWISLSSKIVFGPWWTLSLLIQLAQIWNNEHWWWQHMQWWWLLRKRHVHTLNKHQVMTFIPLVIETYGCLHFRFHSFFIAYAQTTTAHHQWSSLIRLNVCFLLWTACVHNPTAYASHSNYSMNYCTWSKFLISSYIIVSAPPPLVNLWQMTTLSS